MFKNICINNLRLLSILFAILISNHVGAFEYKNGTLMLSGPGQTSTQSPPQYYYYTKDHLGNIRSVVTKNQSTNAVTEVQRTHYYPYGGIIADISTGQNIQPRLYNGKELDRTNNLFWYDFVARPYDPTRGQFINPDPLAEKYYPWNPWIYCKNSPINRIDPDGKDGIAIVDKENHSINITQIFYYNKNNDLFRSKIVDRDFKGIKSDFSLSKEIGFQSKTWTYNDGENNWSVIFSINFVGLDSDDAVKESLDNNPTGNALIYSESNSDSNGAWYPSDRCIKLYPSGFTLGNEKGSTLMHEIGHSWGLEHENEMSSSPIYGQSTNGLNQNNLGIMSFGKNRSIKQYEIDFGVQRILKTSSLSSENINRIHIRTGSHENIILK